MATHFIKIRLPNNTWSYDPDTPLGEGGLGIVFAGISRQGDLVAIKRINLTASNVANRETLIADSLIQGNYQHIIPILDAGIDLDTDLCYIVMPRAAYSLKAYLAQHGPLSETAALMILRQIAAGLAEVAPMLVHRDLKPDNILFHADMWKIADFGIARFVEHATASRTVKDILTPPYAAPEQWRNEHATTATDIYALGCIAYELLAGQPPFPGPLGADYAEQHGHATPPPLPTTISAPLSELISTMLRKPMGSRPDLLRIIQRIDHCLKDQSNPQSHQQGRHALASLGAEIAQEKAREEALKAEKRTEQQHRDELSWAATLGFKQIVAHFAAYLTSASTQLTMIDQGAQDSRSLGAAIGHTELVLNQPNFTIRPANQVYAHFVQFIADDAFAHSGWNVVGSAILEITTFQLPKVTCGVNLWYMTWNNQSSYRWYEVGYDYTSPFDRSCAPIYLEDLHEADLAATPGISKYTLLSQPIPIDDEDTPRFCDRWATMLALMAKGDYDATRDTYRRLISQ